MNTSYFKDSLKISQHTFYYKLQNVILFWFLLTLGDGRNPEWLLSRLRPLTNMSVLIEHITLCLVHVLCNFVYCYCLDIFAWVCCLRFQLCWDSLSLSRVNVWRCAIALGCLMSERVNTQGKKKVFDGSNKVCEIWCYCWPKHST